MVPNAIVTGGSVHSATSTEWSAPPRLVKAAHEFEAAMMKELLAPLTSGKDILGGEGEEHGSNSALADFATGALGKALSEQGGFGIAKSVLHQLAPKSNHLVNSTVPGDPVRPPSNSPS